MRRTVLAVPILAAFAFIASPAAAQEKTARGTVTAIAADSVTVKVQNADMKFAVDSKTTVEAPGAGTKAREAARAGQPGAKLTDVVKVGQTVEVNYREAGGAMLASRIRSVPASAVTTTDTAADQTSSGTVKTIAATAMTITGSGGGGAMFTQNFVIDANTKVVGPGAGTAAAARGGRTVVTDLVGAGDKVNVSYKMVGTTLHATEIRVTTKAPK